MLCHRILLTAIFIIYSLIPPAHSQDYFQKTYTFHQPSKSFYEIEVLPDGKTAMLSGTVQPQDSTGQCNLLLLDTHGEIIWSKLLVSGRTSYGATLALATDGNLILALNSIDLAGAALASVLKISVATGDILWESYFSLPSSPIPFSQGIVTTNILRIIPLHDGGYAVVANKPTAYSLSAVGLSMVFKLDENGSLVWEKTWADKQSVFCRNIAENSGGELLVSGVKGDSIFSQQSILIKLSPDGALLWDKSFDKRIINNVNIDPEDNIWLSGSGRTSDLNRNKWVQKMNEEGNILWSKFYTIDLPEDVDFAGITIMPNGDAVITGHHPVVNKSNAILARINPAGTMLWARKITASGTNDYLVKVAATASGDIVAGGFSGETFMTEDTWLIKTDPSGNIPNCCLEDCSFSAKDVAITVDSFDLLASDTIQTTIGSTISVVLPPEVNAFCTANAVPDMPNAFTPNGDQLNDLFLPRFTCPPETIRFTVYNRWGNPVFETSDVFTWGWDGLSGGAEAPSDVYFWLLEYDTFIDGRMAKKQDKGEVTLLR